MKKLRLSFVFLAIVLAFASLAPATAYANSNVQNATAPTTNSILTVANKSIAPVTVTLTGPKAYTIYATVGNTTQEIVKGTYQYSYKACGLNYSGALKATGSKSKLPIAKCKTTNLVVVNYNDTTFTVNLVGPGTYYYTLQPHTLVRAKILRGTYQWSGACKGKSYSHTIVIQSARYFIWCS